MLTVMQRHTAIMFVVCLAVLAACRRADKHSGNMMKGQQMKSDCDQIAHTTSLTIEFDVTPRPGRAYVHFVNSTHMDLWFPAQEEPAFKADEEAKTLRIWLGYFDEVYGPYRGRYMLPPMRLVPGGRDVRFEIISPELVRMLLERRLSPRLQARLATKALTESRTRGEQPLEDYIRNSCMIQSVGAAQDT